MTEEKTIIDLELEDGTVEKCEVVDIIDFEEKTYALLIPANTKEEDPEIVIMEYIEEGEEGFFQDIESDDEYEKVCNYIYSLSDEVEEE